MRPSDAFLGRVKVIDRPTSKKLDLPFIGLNRVLRAFFKTNPNSPLNQYDRELVTQSTISMLPTIPPNRISYLLRRF